MVLDAEHDIIISTCAAATDYFSSIESIQKTLTFLFRSTDKSTNSVTAAAKMVMHSDWGSNTSAYWLYIRVTTKAMLEECSIVLCH